MRMSLLFYRGERKERREKTFWFSAVFALSAVSSLSFAAPALAQGTNNPFATPIAATDGVITVNAVEFATIPDINGEAPRMMLLVDEPGTKRLPSGDPHSHDLVLLEWTAKNPAAATYDGGAPRELFRFAHPYPNHNGGMIAFNPLARPGSDEFGLLYVGSADGGSGGDPFNHAQNLASGFGKILRIDPLGTNSANGKYGIPASNPFVKKAGALGEIYAYGLRNPQRFSWDPKNGRMFVADIGQNIVEKISLVTAGANLGWNKWEGSFTYGPREVGLANQRGDAAVTYPVAEFDHTDPLLRRAGRIRSAGFCSTTTGRRRRCCSSFRRRTRRRARRPRRAPTCGSPAGPTERCSCSTSATESFD
jgi:hypothetical protein